jgi:hypothetical protein
MNKYRLVFLRSRDTMNASYNSREPSSTYVHTVFVLQGISLTLNILLSNLLILAIVIHHRLRTICNLLTVNSSVAISFYSSIFIGQLIVGLQVYDDQKRSLCIGLSYLTLVGVNAICYSYLVTGTSQYFFNILYRHKYLLTFSMHYLLIIISWSLSSVLPLLLSSSGQCRGALHIPR